METSSQVPRSTSSSIVVTGVVTGSSLIGTSASVIETRVPDVSMEQARKAHFWKMAFPGIRLMVLAAMFIFFGAVQSARAYTVIGSVFGAFIFSVAGVSFWAGWQGISEAYASTNELFPDVGPNLPLENVDNDGILAIITANRIVNDSFVEFRIDVSASGKNWFVWRRFSDFYQTFQVDSDFAKRTAKSKLPPKRWFGNHLSSSFIAERTDALNRYLFDLLKEHGPRRVDPAIANFFDM